MRIAITSAWNRAYQSIAAGHYDDNVSVGALMGFLYDQGFTQAGFHKQADATGGFWAKR